jgi:hypothetical protein
MAGVAVVFDNRHDASVPEGRPSYLHSTGVNPDYAAANRHTKYGSEHTYPGDHAMEFYRAVGRQKYRHYIDPEHRANGYIGPPAGHLTKIYQKSHRKIVMGEDKSRRE